jgi:hypothetical protein
MFLGLLRSPRGLTYFIRTRMACRTAPHESSIFFIAKIRQLADQT